MFRYRLVAPTLALVALLTTSCAPFGSAPRPIRVELRDGEIVIDSESARFSAYGDPAEVDGDSSGFVTFEVINVGNQTHQFMVVVTNLPADALPVEEGRVRLANPPGDQEIGVLYPQSMLFQDRYANLGMIEPGQTVSVTVGPPPRPDGKRMILLCNIPGHYHQGERVVLDAE
jgi:hypothetical protein